MHHGQLDVTLDLVRLLVDEQFPAWAGRPLRMVDVGGTVNQIVRIGDDLVARFPLLVGEGADATASVLRAEADAARELEGATTVPVPAPVAVGEPGHDYPLPWSVWTWVDGVPASVCDASASWAFADDLAGFIRQVRAIPTRGRTFDGLGRSGRGGQLRDHDGWLDLCLARSVRLVDVDRVRGLWAELHDVPREQPDAMTHGDLIPGNVLVRDGRLAGVLDVGGLGPADPALDLVAGWHLLAAGPRETLRTALGCDELEWQRGMAWALEQAMGAVWYYVDTNPAMHRMGSRTVARLLGDPD